ncbi:hypothetical protein [Polaribacter sp. IC063]|uniref:hypothetical protein n=1 Tax=Polaribacter sp. IC063 TaxID=57031 RepID=UPI0011BDEDA9|nr:hypothetical protein [Polaribacter sp. IC063]TXD51334.1 hypothetical protein ES043_12240 [Polaribacter sp. IC063]
MNSIKNFTRYGLLLLAINTILYSCQPKVAAAETPKELAAYEVSPNEETNVKIVSSYINALLTNDQETAKSLVGDGFMNYGPSSKDSLDIKGVIQYWDNIYKARSNQDSGIIATTSLRVNEGNLAGEWVHVWGNYSANLNNSDYTYNLPFHSAFVIKDNKIVRTQTWYDNLSIALDLGSVAPVQAE